MFNLLQRQRLHLEVDFFGHEYDMKMDNKKDLVSRMCDSSVKSRVFCAFMIEYVRRHQDSFFGEGRDRVFRTQTSSVCFENFSAGNM